MILTPSSPPFCRKQAFTLLEMVTVMAILALLMGVSAFMFFGQKDAAREDRARADIQIIQQGLEAYKARFGDYPRVPDTYPNGITSNSEYLLNALCGQIGPTGDIISGTGIPVMLNTSPLTYSNPGLPLSAVQANSIIDPWGSEYEYDYKPDDNTWEFFGYELRSYGPNGKRDTGVDDLLAE
ncbi:prepilin-type N-terminal cleavage/methylation domain-containing protein [Pelagicoccus sp. SDUM812002]|uniref:prepilin-type N-terminal cleavage/methylation domain-containing protein n=1 Tax=Pelagicoccus sp. SDUM812002 TaxID=3041266 RepID=UPI00280CBC3E|nr:prepilin-type N-terminal cleavage/methylation domain-containing protein [Pelagicoccus sp. SDUM812002]MDQ8187567.1 type II secretion system protein GspG [Pelagicoccus sp. SDUM812002]